MEGEGGGGAGVVVGSGVVVGGGVVVGAAMKKTNA